MKSYRADYVFPVNADPIKNGVVTVDNYGKIISVNTSGYPGVGIETLKGVLCPGFINTHCHLELSHLKGKTPQGTGLVDFIIAVQKLRNAGLDEVSEAAREADQEMYDNGIVAVGDISNSAHSIPVKTASKLYYHTFIELFSFLPDRAAETFDRALKLMKQFEPMPASVAPHAPYSVSKELFRLIRDYCEDMIICLPSTIRKLRRKTSFTGTSWAGSMTFTAISVSISAILNPRHAIPCNQ